MPFPKLSHDLKDWITIMNRNYEASMILTLMHDRHEQSDCHSKWKITPKEFPYNLQTPAEIEKKHTTLNVLLQFAHRNTIREFV